MTDHANELRRYSRKIGPPAGDVPAVMLAAADEIERLAARLEAAEKERDECNRRRLEAADHFAAQTALMKKKYDALRAKIEAMKRQEPVATVDANDEGYWAEILPDRSVRVGQNLYALPGAQQCKNCNGMGDRFDPSGEKIPCDLCESNLEEIRVLVAEAAHDIVSGSDFWLSTSLTAKKIYALPGAKGE